MSGYVIAYKGTAISFCNNLLKLTVNPIASIEHVPGEHPGIPLGSPLKTLRT